MPGLESVQAALDLAPLAVALILAGFVSGALGGLFGVGGGAILVPVLYQLFILLGIDEAVRMQLAVGTSLGIIVPTSLRSLSSHYSHNAVDIPYLRRIALWVVVGVLLGSLAASVVSGVALRAVFAILAMANALSMLLLPRGFQLGAQLPGAPLFQLVGTGIGFFSVLMGVGGGVFSNLFMTFYGHSIHRAVATSSGIGVMISIPGMIGFMAAGWGRPELPAYSLGFVSLLGVALVIPTSLYSVPYGARLAHRLSRDALKRAFALFLLLISLRFFVSLF